MTVPVGKTELKEVAPNVYAYIQENGEWFVNNAGLIVGDKYTVVVDTLANEPRVKRFIDELKKVTDKSARFLINTHGHGDHTWTNHFFPEATTICQTRCREVAQADVRTDNETLSKRYAKLFPKVDFTGAKCTPQDIIFEKELTLYIDPDRPIKAVYAGMSHTNAGDTYVYLPKEKVVFCGDLLFSEPCTPFAQMGYIPGLIRALDELATLDADTYVPGHGPVSSKEALYRARDYLVFIYEEARKRFKRGMTLDEAVEDIDLGPYKGWGEMGRIVGNVARAYSEFRGEPPGTPLPTEAIMAKMFDYEERSRG